MSWFANLKLTHKILSAVLLGAMLSGIAAAYGMSTTREVTKLYEQTNTNHLRSIATLGTASAAQLFNARAFVRISGTSDRQEQAQLITSVLVFAALLGSVLFGVLIARSISRQIGGEPEYVRFVVQRVAQGDMSVDVKLAEGDQSSLRHRSSARRRARQRLRSGCGRSTQARGA